MEYTLKHLEDRNLTEAMDLARHYRDLNLPEEAESICRDVLATAPDNEDAWRTLGLALTDRFGKDWVHLFDEATQAFSKLKSPYERAYYKGVAWERYAKAQLEAADAHNAIHAFEQAMDCYEEAAKIGSADTPAPILRYNRCVRALTTNPAILRASKAPRRPHSNLGD